MTCLHVNGLIDCQTIKLHLPNENIGFSILATFNVVYKRGNHLVYRDHSMLHLKHLFLCFVDLTLSKVAACLLDNCVGKRVNVLLQKHYCFSWKKKKPGIAPTRLIVEKDRLSTLIGMARRLVIVLC